MSRSWRAAVIVVVIGVAIGIHALRAPLRAAARLKPGDSAERVRELLGEPELSFRSTAELRESYLQPMSFVFSDLAGRKSDLPADKLPSVTVGAEWFEFGYGSAGHLVYYDDQGVTAVWWGGT